MNPNGVGSARQQLAPIATDGRRSNNNAKTSHTSEEANYRRLVDRAPLLSVDAIRKLHAERDARKAPMTTADPNWSVSYHRQALSSASEGTPGVLANARNALASAAPLHGALYQSPQRRRLAEAQLENERIANEILLLEQQRQHQQQAFELNSVLEQQSSTSRSLGGVDVGNLAYLRNHSVVPLFNELLADLLKTKPEDPIGFLIDNLKELQEEVSAFRQQIERESVRQLASGKKKQSIDNDAPATTLITPQPTETHADERTAVDKAVIVPSSSNPATCLSDSASAAFAEVVREDAGMLPLVGAVIASAGSSEEHTGNKETVAESRELIETIPTVKDNVPSCEGAEDTVSIGAAPPTTAIVLDNSTVLKPLGGVVETTLLDGYSDDQLEKLQGRIPYLKLLSQSGSTVSEGIVLSVAPVGLQLLLRSCLVPTLVRSSSLILSNPLTPVATKRLGCLSLLRDCIVSSGNSASYTGDHSELLNGPLHAMALLLTSAGSAVRPSSNLSATPESRAISPTNVDIKSLKMCNVDDANPTAAAKEVDEALNESPPGRRGIQAPVLNPMPLDEKSDVVSPSESGPSPKRPPQRPPSSPSALRELPNSAPTPLPEEAIPANLSEDRNPQVNTTTDSTSTPNTNSGGAPPSFEGIELVVAAAKRGTDLEQALHGLETLSAACHASSSSTQLPHDAMAPTQPSTPAACFPKTSGLTTPDPSIADQQNVQPTEDSTVAEIIAKEQREEHTTASSAFATHNIVAGEGNDSSQNGHSTLKLLSELHSDNTPHLRQLLQSTSE